MNTNPRIENYYLRDRSGQAWASGFDMPGVHIVHPTPDDRSREVLSPGLVIIAAADLPADLVRAERGRSGGRSARIDRSIDRS